jgi:hypothetical protein
MLQRRETAGAYNVAIRYTVDGKPLAALSADVAGVESEIN